MPSNSFCFWTDIVVFFRWSTRTKARAELTFWRCSQGHLGPMTAVFVPKKGRSFSRRAWPWVFTRSLAVGFKVVWFCFRVLNASIGMRKTKEWKIYWNWHVAFLVMSIEVFGERFYWVFKAEDSSFVPWCALESHFPFWFIVSASPWHECVCVGWS